MRQYDDPVEVRRGETEGPDQFLWRGRLWKVRAVLAHWVETGPWWQSSGVRALVGSDDPTRMVGSDDATRMVGSDDATRMVGSDDAAGAVAEAGVTDLLVERELWRVEAGRDRDHAGVFDLSFNWTDGCWQLVGCAD